MSKRLAAAVVGTLTAVLLACAGTGKPECNSGSLKNEHGRISHCIDNHDGTGPHWKRQ